MRRMERQKEGVGGGQGKWIILGQISNCTVRRIIRQRAKERAERLRRVKMN